VSFEMVSSLSSPSHFQGVPPPLHPKADGKSWKALPPSLPPSLPPDSRERLTALPLYT
jgi:hypothetical protein